LSNLKQIGLGIAMYADNYNGRMPQDNANTPTLTGSFNLLSNVITSAKVFTCPSDSASKLNPNYPLTNSTTINNISYSYSVGLIWQDQPDSIIALDRMGTAKGSTAATADTPRARSGLPQAWSLPTRIRVAMFSTMTDMYPGITACQRALVRVIHPQRPVF